MSSTPRAMELAAATKRDAKRTATVRWRDSQNHLFSQRHQGTKRSLAASQTSTPYLDFGAVLLPSQSAVVPLRLCEKTSSKSHRSQAKLSSRFSYGWGGESHFTSPSIPSADILLPSMTAIPQSSPPGPERFRSPETIGRCASGHRKNSRPAASHADVRSSSSRPWLGPGIAFFDAARVFTCPDSLVVCTGVRTDSISNSKIKRSNYEG